MKKLRLTISENKFYLITYSLFLLLGFGLLAVIEKGEIIVWVNGFHSVVPDYIFHCWTKVGEEIAFFVVLVILLFRQVRAALYIPFVGLSVSLVSFILKTIFSRPRPASFFSELGILDQLQKVDMVHLYEANTSFPSGHTMAGFALFSYFAFCLKSEWLKMICLVIALGIGFSRIYLIQHFLEDVCFGSICGVLIAIIFYTMKTSFKTSRHQAIDLPIYKMFAKKKIVT